MLGYYEPMFEDDALKNLKLYRYSAVDKSPLMKYVLRHYWDFAVKLFPRRMAPNLITLFGFVFIMMSICTLVVFLHDLEGPAPGWVYYSFALALFLYQTFDNVDGRQARRTKTSSALGHIFDHTIDSLNMTPSALLGVAGLSLGHSRDGLFFMLVGIWAFWLSTWEEYYTETLYLGYFNGPNEGLLLASILQCVTGFYGPAVWDLPLGKIFTKTQRFPDVQLRDVVVTVVWLTATIIHSPACFYNVYIAYRQKKKSFSPAGALCQHIPFLIYNVLVLSWVLSPHSQILGSGSHKRGALIEFSLLLTATFGKLAPRVILARLTQSPFPWFNLGAFGPIIIGCLLVNIPFSQRYLAQYEDLERWYLRIAVLWAVLDFVTWFVKLCNAFCRELNIACLTIQEKKGE